MSYIDKFFFYCYWDGMHVHDKLGKPDGATQMILYLIHIAVLVLAILHKRPQLHNY